MFRFHKLIFLKLYRYYLKKLFWTWLIYASLILILSLIFWNLTWNFRIGGGGNIWNETWKFFLLKTSMLFYLSSALVSSLVWEAVKKEDAAALTISSPINRQNILVAKIASFFVYYWISSFLLSLPILLLSSGSSDFTWINGLIFLVFDSFLLVLVGFLLFCTPLFYFNFPARSKGLKFMVFLFYFILLFGFFLAALSVDFLKTPWIPILLSFPVGFGFLSLYWDDFRQHDYT